MKKKIISMVLVLCLVCVGFLLTACDNAETLLEKATDNTEALNDISAKTELRISMEIDGATMSIPMIMDMKIKNAKSENPITYIDYDMNVFGESVNMVMYTENGWVYVLDKESGEGYKMQESDVTANDLSENIDDLMQDIPEDLLKDVKVIKNDDGSKTVTVSIPDDTFADIYDDFLSGMDDMLAAGAEVDMAISNAVVEITVKDDYITVYDIAFDMAMTAEGETVNANISAKVTFDEPGESVTITPPEGYQNFVEMAE